MSLNLERIAALLNVHKETIGHPNLKPIGDATMRELEELAAGQREEEAKIRADKLKAQQERTAREAEERQAEVDRRAAEHLEAAEEQARLQREAEARALAESQVPAAGDPNVMARHPRVEDGVIVGDDTKLQDELSEEQSETELKPMTLDGHVMDTSESVDAPRPPPAERGQPTNRPPLRRFPVERSESEKGSG